MRTKTKIPIQASVDISLDEWVRARVEQEERPYSYFVNKALRSFATARDAEDEVGAA